MKNSWLLLVLLFGLTSCYTPPSDCKNYKTGVFEYQTYADGKLIQAKIVRNDSLEIDFYNPQEPDTSAIRWVNDCEYVLRKYNARASDEKKSFTMQIITTDKDGYTFLFSEVGDSRKKEFSARRIEE